MSEPNNLYATVFVYKHKTTGEIAAHYMAASLTKSDSDEWEHVASLEPRLWIQSHYAQLEPCPNTGDLFGGEQA